ncbi:glycosyltransferase [Niveibacterium terrae]|uniref:glycosyltransferase n=1 Tax=Niveibacterium terrae TaxID=3373598 RepID=UPI003A8CE1F9
MKRLLMIAYHFPPHSGSSGIQRTLNLARALPAFGWQPEILTANRQAYESARPIGAGDLPDGLIVHRALALDAKRHLAIMGHYPGFLARPDRWRSWWLPATMLGLRLIASGRFDALWSTFPIATAHRIGASLARLSGLPWVADLRDPMAHDGYPRDPAQWKAYEKVERRVFERASAIVTVTPGCAEYYRRRYPQAAAHIHLIRNGADPWPEDSPPAAPGAHFVLLHSGLIYPWERDPSALFDALALLRVRRPDLASRLRLVLRAPGASDWLVALARSRSIETLVEILPPLDSTAARREMRQASALLVLQAENCALQIPAKLYEYARTALPIISLSSPGSDTWSETLKLGGACTALDDPEAISTLLTRLIEDPASFARQADTSAGTSERGEALARLLDSLAPGLGISSSKPAAREG